jgi:pimeloyl-ACP methyl ester carboxylesterase
MEVFYFGKPPFRLFGVYHPPASLNARDTGIVLCYPVGHEYIRCHRAFLRLSMFLSSIGFHVLRFDYGGCGDSEGSCEAGTLSQWITDISTAVDELKGGCDIDRICLVGLRLGGGLSIKAAVERGDIDGLVLWDTVVNGSAYMRELRKHHREWIQGSFAKSLSMGDDCRFSEILGFPLTDRMIKEIEEIDLLSLRRKPAKNIFIIETDNEVDRNIFREHLLSVDARVYHEFIQEPQVWIKKSDELSKGLVPVKTLETIVTWISQVM